MSHVFQCVQMKVSYGLVECVLQVKNKVTMCCRCIWMLSLYLFFGGFFGGGWWLFTSFDENILILVLK